MKCYNDQCNGELPEQVNGKWATPVWAFTFGDRTIYTCSDACYMFSRLLLEHPKLEEFRKEFKGYHPRWIARMHPFLDGFEKETPKPRTFWQKVAHLPEILNQYLQR
jgi:hypothetical protein